MKNFTPKRADFKKNGFTDYAQGMVCKEMYECETRIREFLHEETEELLNRLFMNKTPQLFIDIAKHFDEMNHLIDAEEEKQSAYINTNIHIKSTK